MSVLDQAQQGVSEAGNPMWTVNRTAQVELYKGLYLCRYWHEEKIRDWMPAGHVLLPEPASLEEALLRAVAAREAYERELAARSVAEDAPLPEPPTMLTSTGEWVSPDNWDEIEGRM